MGASGGAIYGDPGLPQSAIDAGITTTAGYQAYNQQQIADQQMAAQKAIADQQNTYNQQQLAAMQAQQAQQQQAAQDQANRQTTYDQGRAANLNAASQQINDAFAAFTPDYFNQYAQSYTNQAADQLAYQRQQADRTMNYGLARQGLSDSQARANATGILDETQGRALADQIQAGQSQAAQLQSQVSQAKQGLLGQVQNAGAIAPPIAGATMGDVTGALQTQNNAISGIAGNAGNLIASLKGVPTVSGLGNIFSGVLGNLGSYLGGAQAQNQTNAFNTLSGTNPNAVR